MLEFNTPITKEKTYTPIPAGMLDRVEPWLQRNNISYTVMNHDEVPDNVPQCYTFRGRTSFFGVTYIAANLDSAELIKAVEKMLTIKRSEI